MKRIWQSLKHFLGVKRNAEPLVKGAFLSFDFPNKYKRNEELLIITAEDKRSLRKRKLEKINFVATHSGNFHCDEVMATIILKYADLLDEGVVVRSRDEEILKEAKIVYDVGNKLDPHKFLFDHHMIDFKETFSPNHSVKLSSCGLIYKYHGRGAIENILLAWKVQSPKYIDYTYYNVYDNLIMTIDAIDNGVDQYPSSPAPHFNISTDLKVRIGRLNSSPINLDANTRFKIALDICEEELLWQVFISVKEYSKSLKVVRKAYKERYTLHPSGRLIKLNYNSNDVRLLDVVESESSDEKVMFIIDGDKELYSIYGILVKPDEYRLLLNEKLRGLQKEELEKVVPDGILVSADGFFGSGKTLASVLKMAEMSIKGK
eukprot:TRINITY_DN3015_c0_g2_i2.p1 TRINITY_DN3015_c0_g2~~TRINITY_DN3015_c0_g2_i2.p1  ORF type:complete len:400 (+),score=56.62 TRINITY_DN3015_c0_g2_i2:78-1202(+)